MNPRMQRARQIMSVEGHASQIGLDRFKVRSQTDPNKFYIITKTEEMGSLTCECPDHQTRQADCKHIKVVLEYIRKNVFGHDGFRIMERSKLNLCKYCDSGNIKKMGFRKTKNGDKAQIYGCKDCNKRFTANFGFEKMRSKDYIITRSLDMYYKGMSVRDIADNLEQEEIEVSHMTIYRWIDRYSKLTSAYLNGIVPRVGNWFRADEVWVKINGKQCYLFASMDDDTRYWLASDIADNKFQHNADNLLKLTKKQAGNKSPRNFITDGLPAYMKSSKKVFGKKTNHVRHIHIAGKREQG